MAKPTGFLEYERQNPPKRKVEERVKDFAEIEQLLDPAKLHEQAARCMDCGIPTCHAFGCPVKNLIPDWNDLIYRNQWEKACAMLHSTNNLPEMTGRICPAPCEAACTLELDGKPVTIRQIELQIVEKGFKEGWIKPQLAKRRTGKKVAVVGSGPAGLSAAQQLAREGHEVTLFEKAGRIGGYLRYGIPDYKLDKNVIDRRMRQMEAEGVVFKTNTQVTAESLQKEFDATLLTIGAGVPRDLTVPGRELKGVHFALEFLTQQNMLNAGDPIPEDQRLSAKGKHVVVVGGGDTGSDCIGTSIRQGAVKVTQIELLSQPPQARAANNPWPYWPTILRTSSSHEEGCERMWDINTKEMIGKDGQVTALKAVKLEWTFPEGGRPSFKEIPGSAFDLKADLVLLAMGFLHADPKGLVSELKLETDGRGNIKVDDHYRTSQEGVFAAGDAETGASLVVRAINRGREAAGKVSRFLQATR